MPHKVLTEAEKDEARQLAVELKKIVDKNFLEPPKPEAHEKLQGIRRRLEELGFNLTLDYNLDPQTSALDSAVTLWLPKQIH